MKYNIFLSWDLHSFKYMVLYYLNIIPFKTQIWTIEKQNEGKKKTIHSLNLIKVLWYVDVYDKVMY